MAILEARGYCNKPTSKVSQAGKEYFTFTLAVPQKSKDSQGKEVKETMYVNCTDFSEDEKPSEAEYVGVTGYFSALKWERNGKSGINFNLKVTKYERMEQKPKSTVGQSFPAAQSAGSDPFALGPDLSIPF